MQKERRSHPRSKPAHEYAVVCWTSDPATNRGRGVNLADRLIDLSKRGICITTTGRLRVGLPVALDLALPGEGSRFTAEAIVRWSETVESKGRHRQTAHVAGLEILRVLDARGEKLGPLIAWVDHPVTGATPERRRRARRFNPPTLTLVCSPTSFMSRLALGSNLVKRLKDLSEGGAQIVSAKKLEKGQRLVIKLGFGDPRCTIAVEGEVLWCRRDTLILEPTWYAGIRFLNVTPDDLDNLRTLEKKHSK